MADPPGRCAFIKGYLGQITRKKRPEADMMVTNLRRCLTLTDVTLLGIGHMVGSGIYVVTGTEAKNIAGPSIVLAFLLAGVASFLAALCYAEMGVRFPRAGSAYAYTYYALGEIWAFFVGWNVALEHTISAATVARAGSEYIDSLANRVIENGTVGLVGRVHAQYLSSYINLFAGAIVLAFVIFSSFGVRSLSTVNSVFTAVNLAVICLVIAVGSYFSDASNWSNFFPFGFDGVLSASSSCFFSYVGFDSIASAGEEAKDPKRTLPLATMISMVIVSVAYFGVSAVLTLMVRYDQLTGATGLADAFGSKGANWVKIVVVIGACCGMSTALIGALYALTRTIYNLSDDGLIFPVCSWVNAKTKIPLGALYSFSAVSFIMALILDVQSLVELLSIGTLFGYTLVSLSVLVLRYKPIEYLVQHQEIPAGAVNEPANAEQANAEQANAEQAIADPAENPGGIFNRKPGQMVQGAIISYSFFTIAFLAFTFKYKGVFAGEWWAVLLAAVFGVGMLASLIFIACHKDINVEATYKVPFSPWTPALSVFINVLFLIYLQKESWIRFLVWVVFGLLLYLGYGVRHSKQRNPPQPLNHADEEVGND